MIKKSNENYFRIISLIVLLWSSADAYFLLKYEHFSQLFWFCNAALFLLAIGFYFRKSIIMTAVLVGALVVQIPWDIDFFIHLLFGYDLFGLTAYMFEYGFRDIRFYTELDHLLIIPLSLYGVYKLGFHKNGWILGSIYAIFINTSAYLFSSKVDNVNCVFYSCFVDKIITKENPLLYFFIWTISICVLMFVLNKIIYGILIKRANLKAT